MTTPDRPLRAAAFMLVSAMSFTLMGVAVRMAGDIPTVEKVFFRNLVTLAITATMVWRDGRGLLDPLRSPHRLRLLMRSVFGLAGVFLYFFALDNLTLADAAMLNKLSPFFVFILAALLLGERMTGRVGLALAGAFGGALLIIKPGFDLAALPAAAGAGSALCAASAYTLLRSLKNREPAHRIIFVFSLISTVATAGPMAAGFVAPDPGQWPALLGIGLFAAGGQFFLTWAYQSAPAGRISILNHSSIVFSLLVGWVLWREMPDRWSLVGGALILLMAVVTQVGGGRRPSAAVPSPGSPVAGSGGSRAAGPSGSGERPSR